MTHLLITVFSGQVPAELVRVPTDRPAVLVTWEVEPGKDGPTLRFNVAATQHPHTPTDPNALAGMLHALVHGLLGPASFPTAMPDADGGQ